MRLLGFTLLVIAVATGVDLALTHLPYSLNHVLGKFTLVLMFVLPMIATVALAYATRFPDVIYLYFLVFFSPFAAAILSFLFSLFVLNEPML